MSIKVKIFYPGLQMSLDNLDIVEVDGSTVGECLHSLIRQFPGSEKWIFDQWGQLLEQVFVYINAESPCKADLAAPVREKDDLIIAMMVIGG